MADLNENKKGVLFAEERRSKIVQLIQENSKMIVPELCQIFDVSPATIRNDLRDLEKSGLLRRTHGGAINLSKSLYEPDTGQKEIKMHAQKKAIAECALDLIEDGDTLVLDTGTTTLELAKLLDQKRNITVVTIDLNIACYLEKYTTATIIMVGGIIRRSFNCVIGPMTISWLRNFNVDKAFLATNGLSAKKGLTTPDMNVAEVKKTLRSIANEVFLLADSSKLGYDAFVQVATLDQIDSLITDSGADADELSQLRDAGLQIQIAEDI